MKPKDENGIERARFRPITLALATARRGHPDLADAISGVVPHVIRDRPKETVPERTVSDRVTPELARKARDTKYRDPSLTDGRIGDALLINPGRVSEALHGLR